jgi:ParB/RepB/Spo0J family partition protein
MIEKKKLSPIADKDGTLFVALSDIEVEPGFNNRTPKNAEPDDGLIQSIIENGVKQPIQVRYKDRKQSGFFIVDGERRWRASAKAGKGSIPVVNLGFCGDKEALAISCIVSGNQKPLNRKESLASIRKLHLAGYLPEQIVKITTRDERFVNDALTLLKNGTVSLRSSAQKGVKDGGIDTRVAARVAVLPPKEQKKIIPHVMGVPRDQGLGAVRQVERKMGVNKPGPRAIPPPSPPTKAKSSVGIKTGYFVEDAEERCKQMEKILMEKRNDYGQPHKVWDAQLLIINCLKGRLSPTDIFGWRKI